MRHIELVSRPLQKKQRPRHWDGDVQSERMLQEFERLKALSDIFRRRRTVDRGRQGGYLVAHG